MNDRSMSSYSYLCTYVCVYLSMYACVYVCIYVCVYVSVYVCVYVCVCIPRHDCSYAFAAYAATAAAMTRVGLDFIKPGGARTTLNRNIAASLDAKGNTKKKEQDVTLTRLATAVDGGTGAAGADDTRRRKKTIRLKTKDVEQQLPGMVGVSKAVLDNVIFVHQEEANWPLGGSATLKKRFDDMFVAARYMKALETMRTIAKTYARYRLSSLLLLSTLSLRLAG